MNSATTPKASFVLPVITRLAALSVDEAKLVFDKVGNSNVLSEIWVAGEDGYLVHITKGAHTHQVTKSEKQ
jgi:hypothetical protein